MMQSLVKLKNKNKGFTLVELIVVIAIIGILAAIMMPKFFGFTDDARKSAALSEAKSIRTLCESYYGQYGVWPTITAGGSSGTPPTYTSTLTLSAPSASTTTSSPDFPGVISDYSASATTAGSGISAFPTEGGSFNYTSNTGHTISCNSDGNVVANN